MVRKGMVSGRVLHDMASGLGVSDMRCCAVLLVRLVGKDFVLRSEGAKIAI